MSFFGGAPLFLAALAGTVGTGLFLKSSGGPNVTPDILAKHRYDISSYTPEAQKDFIQDLPGLHYDPGFKQFSGYLTVKEDHGRNLFYWYVESEGDPETDPVVLWTNGGPGCSGLIGFGTEHGPFFIGKQGRLSENYYSWNKVASMLYIEQPAGVGFSYSDTESDYTTGDKQAAIDNYQLILEFLNRFPERRTNPFFISSESYGGHYMPQLTMQILEKNTDKHINFQGMMVGNPFVDPYSNTVTQVRAFYAHGLLPRPLYFKWDQECTDPSTYDTKECEKITIEMFQGLYGKINPYALDYPICTEKKHKHGHDLDQTEETDITGRGLDDGADTASSQVVKLMNSSSAGGPPFLPTEDVYRPCSEVHLNAYLNREDVREALHVSPSAPKKWKECSDVVKYSEEDFSATIIQLYEDVVTKAKEHNIDIFVFSGDDDSVCSTAGTQWWIWDLGVAPMADNLWKPWKVDDQTVGFVTKFEMGLSNATFTFATVHGAGHEVPSYRPKEALRMFKNVLARKW